MRKINNIKEAKYNGEADGLAVVEPYLDGIVEKSIPFQYEKIIHVLSSIKKSLNNGLVAPKVEPLTKKKVSKIFSSLETLLKDVPNEYKETYLQGVNKGITEHIDKKIEELKEGHSKVQELLATGHEGRNKLIENWIEKDLASQVKILERKILAKNRAKYNIPESYKEGERDKRFKRFTAASRNGDEIKEWNKKEDEIEIVYPKMLKATATTLSLEVEAWKTLERSKYHLMAEVNDPNKSVTEIKEIIDNYHHEQKEINKAIAKKLAAEQKEKITGEAKTSTEDYLIVKAGIITKEQAELFNYQELNTYDAALSTQEYNIKEVFNLAKNYYPNNPNKGLEELANLKYEKIFDLLSKKDLIKLLKLKEITFNRINELSSSKLILLEEVSKLIDIPYGTIFNYSNENMEFIRKAKEGKLELSDISSETPKELLGLALIYSAEHNQYNILFELKAKGVDFNTKTKAGFTALHLAAEKGHTDIITKLIDLGADIDARNSSGQTPLYSAIFNNYKDTIAKLIDLGANVNVKDENGHAPLNVAVSKCDKDTIAKLIKSGADINAKDQYGQTPLHKAAYYGKIEAIDKLIDLGANVNAKDENGQTPLHIAVVNDYSYITAKLIDLDADVNAKDKNGQTPLHKAASYGNKIKEVAKLIESGADVNVKDNNGSTALHRAARGSHTNIIAKLIESGADVNAKDKNGQTPLDVTKSREAKELLRAAKIKIDTLHKRLDIRIEATLNELAEDSHFKDILKKHKLDKYVADDKKTEKKFKGHAANYKSNLSDSNRGFLSIVRDFIELMEKGELISKKSEIVKDTIAEVQQSDKYRNKYKSKINKINNGNNNPSRSR